MNSLNFRMILKCPILTLKKINPDFKSHKEEGKNRHSWIAAAATVIIVTFGTLGALFFFDLIDPHNTEKITAEPDFREIITRDGQRAILNLSDGSNIILNAGSTLKIPEMFHPDEPRTVFLSGEAYFEVRVDAAKPFEVYTEESVTHVLGTKFVVTSYPDKEICTGRGFRRESCTAGEERVFCRLTDCIIKKIF